MPSIDFPLDDKTIRMPNGANLIIVDGTLPISYSMAGPDRECGFMSRHVEEFYADGPLIELTAQDDDEREIKLALPVQHPSIADLISQNEDAITEACAADDEAGGDDDDDYDRESKCWWEE